MAFLSLLLLNLSVSPMTIYANSSEIEIVKPSNMGDWIEQTHMDADVDFVSGPETPPLGDGSVEFSIGSNGDSGAFLHNHRLDGEKLSDIHTLEYSTYVSSYKNGQAPYLTLDIDYDDDGTVEETLVFEPVYQTGEYSGDKVPNQCHNIPNCVALNEWQTWNALEGGWWSVNDGNSGPPLVTLDSILHKHPDARVVNSEGYGGLSLAAGFGAGAWDDFVGNADALTIKVGEDEVTYDFEPNQEGECGVDEENHITHENENTCDDESLNQVHQNHQGKPLVP